MTNETIDYGAGHICRPNGHGDYERVCPRAEAGERPRLVPFMFRNALDGQACQCGHEFPEGRPVEPTPADRQGFEPFNYTERS